MLYSEVLSTPASLLETLREGRSSEFKTLLRSQPETIVDAAFEEASRDERLVFLCLLPVERAASTFTDLPLLEQAEFVSDLAPDRLRIMGAFIGPDEVADLLQALERDPEKRQHLLSSLPPTLAERARELERYKGDEAGGLMTPEYVALREDMTAVQALGFLRQAAGQAETLSHLYLVDAQSRLLGELSLERLVTAAPGVRVADLARRGGVYAQTNTDQEEVARLMRDYDLSSLPVVDESGVLRGIVTVDDVLDVIQEEATEDIYKGVAMEGSEIDYLRTPVTALWRKRVLWLAGLAVSEFLTASVIKSFEDEIAAQTALAAFLPTLTATGGNTGSQSAILVVRAIATGQVRGRDAVRVAFKELSTGVLLGVVLAAFAYVRVRFLYTQPLEAAAVAMSMFVIIVVANVIGGLLPLLFNKLKIDPAVTSSPFLTTVMDATGLLIYFNIARWLLKL